MAPRPGKSVIAPNLGLYLDRPSLDVPTGALVDGFNFRVKLGTLQGTNMGWVKFTDDWVLDGPVLLIDNFFPRDQDEHLIFGTATSLYAYDPDDGSIRYLNPVWTTGAASASGTAVTGTSSPAWLANVQPGDFIRFGVANDSNPNSNWFEIATVNSDTSLTLVAPVGTVVSGPYTIRRVFHMSIFDEWDYDTFVLDSDSGDDLWIATNGTDPVISWNGTDATVTLHPEMNFTCGTLAVFSNMMVYGNVISGGVAYPSSIINSDVGYPLHAGDAGTGLSEQFRIHDGTDVVINLVPLGDNLAIYSTRHISTAQFVGDPLIFAFRTAASGVGPVSNNAIADFGDFHEILGADAQYNFDGMTLTEINTHVFREALRTADPMRRIRVYGHFDEENGDLIWSIPATTDDGVGVPDAAPEIAWVEHYLEDAGPNLPTPFSKRYFPFTYTGFYFQSQGLTWADMTQAWNTINYSWDDQFFQANYPTNIAGDANGQIYTLHKSSTADGVILPSWVRFGRMAMGSGRERSLLTRVYPFAQQLPGNLEVTVYSSLSASAQMTLRGAWAFDQLQPDEYHFVSPFIRGRFIEIQFGTNDGTGYILEGWSYDSSTGGTR